MANFSRSLLHHPLFTETMTHQIDVLDKGYVRLVEHMGTDLSVVRAARVSYDADWRTGENEGSDAKLIRYLWKHHHTSPFEAATLTFEVKAPIFVFRQWHRHRTQSYNEVSARYTELPDEFYIPDPAKIGQQSAHNKQVRDIALQDSIPDARMEQVTGYAVWCQQTFITYKTLLADGWPRELARMVLPLSTYSRMFDTMNLLNLFKFLTLRLHPHAQWEIQEYARAIVTLIEPHFPVAVAAWRESQPSEPLRG
jgi:thymidylate synthase (FAD)